MFDTKWENSWILSSTNEFIAWNQFQFDGAKASIVAFNKIKWTVDVPANQFETNIKRYKD